jgi:medium-chain acyl-[acyl-carrier-protein] hydrolase
MVDTPEIHDLTVFCPFRVTSADTDMESRLRPGALLNMLIQSAIQSADSLGFGFGSLRQEKLFWVLSRMSVDIQRPMHWYEEAVVETWPKDVDGLLYLRDFIVRDAQKNIVASATSAWLAVDMISKRPRIIEGLDASRFVALKEKHALNRMPEKLNGLTGTISKEVPTTYFDFDLNRHVTSTRYIDWTFDTFPMEFLLRTYPVKLSVNFLKETRPGEIMQIRQQQINEKIFTFEGVHKSTNQASFRALYEFS